MGRRKVGLALGSGAARGLAHIGVLDVLREEGIPVDMVAGTSAGALIGALYAHSKNIKQIESWALALRARRMISLVDPSVPRSGLIMGKNVKRLLSSYLQGDVQFAELRMPFACVATDIETGEEMVFDDGSVLEALRASISIPGVFSVSRWKGRHLVDGALVNPIPVDVLLRMGADFIIAVNVIPEASIEAQKVARRKKDTFGTARTIQQVSSLAERLVNEKVDTLRQSRIIAEMVELVGRLAEQGTRVVGTPQVIQGVSSELRTKTQRKTATWGSSRLVQALSGRAHQLATEHRARLKEPGIIDVLLQSLNISAYSLVRTSLAAADITITPRVGHIGLADFTKGRECIEQGRLAASDAIPEIKRQMGID